MAEFKMIAPISPLDVPALGRVLERGESFEVPEHLAEYFDAQPELWERIGAAAGGAQETETGTEEGESE